jgi:hypothetical protein
MAIAGLEPGVMHLRDPISKSWWVMVKGSRGGADGQEKRPGKFFVCPKNTYVILSGIRQKFLMYC